VSRERLQCVILLRKSGNDLKPTVFLLYDIRQHGFCKRFRVSGREYYKEKTHFLTLGDKYASREDTVM